MDTRTEAWKKYSTTPFDLELYRAIAAGNTPEDYRLRAEIMRDQILAEFKVSEFKPVVEALIAQLQQFTQNAGQELIKWGASPRDVIVGNRIMVAAMKMNVVMATMMLDAITLGPEDPDGQE